MPALKLPVSSVNLWLCTNADALRSGAASHTSIPGSGVAVPQQLEADFLIQYADDMDNCGSQLYFSEVVTDVAPFFVELHWHEQDCVEHSDAYAAAIQLSTAVVKGIAQCVAPVADPPAASQCTSAAGELSYDEMLRIRASLPQTAAVVHTARPYRSDGVDSYHCRVRIIWPNLLVTASTSRQLRAIAITALREHDRRKDWEEVVEDTMYYDAPTLRMLGSFKLEQCSTCCKEDYTLEKQLRQGLAVQLGLADTASQDAVRTEWHSRKQQLDLPLSLRTSAAAYGTLYKKLTSCLGCRGCGWTTAVGISRFSLVAIIDAAGAHLTDFEHVAFANRLLAVHISSVRRPVGTAPSSIRMPAHAPAATLRQFSRRTLNSDGSYSKWESFTIR